MVGSQTPTSAVIDLAESDIELPSAALLLNERQRRFVLNYVVSPNATQAAIEAGYSPASAKQYAHVLLQDSRIKDAIEALLQQFVMSKAELLARMAWLARTSPSESLQLEALNSIAKAMGLGSTPTVGIGIQAQNVPVVFSYVPPRGENDAVRGTGDELTDEIMGEIR